MRALQVQHDHVELVAERVDNEFMEEWLRDHKGTFEERAEQWLRECDMLVLPVPRLAAPPGLTFRVLENSLDAARPTDATTINAVLTFVFGGRQDEGGPAGRIVQEIEKRRSSRGLEYYDWCDERNARTSGDDARLECHRAVEFASVQVGCIKQAEAVR
jgi:hypothetical protein